MRATSVVALMADLKACVWATWFNGHYKLPKQPHTRDTNPRIKRQLPEAEEKRLTDLGASLTTNAKNTFTLRNAAGVTLQATADLVALLPNQPSLLVCVHGESPIPAHAATLLLTLHIYRLTRGQGAEPQTGRLIYSSGHVDVPAHILDNPFDHLFRNTMKDLTATTPPLRTPSPQECQTCPITHDLCPQKADLPPPTPQQSLF